MFKSRTNGEKEMKPQCTECLDFLMPVTADGKTIKYWRCLNCDINFSVVNESTKELPK